MVVGQKRAVRFERTAPRSHVSNACICLIVLPRASARVYSAFFLPGVPDDESKIK